MLSEPGTGFEAIMAGEIICNDEDIASWIVRFDVSEQSNVSFGIARGSAAGQLLTITYAQCSVDPDFLWAALVVQRRFDAMPCRRPAGSGRERAGDNWSQFVSAESRRARRRSGVVADDRYSFGANSFSSLSLQLWVRRQRTPSRI